MHLIHPPHCVSTPDAGPRAGPPSLTIEDCHLRNTADITHPDAHSRESTTAQEPVVVGPYKTAYPTKAHENRFSLATPSCTRVFGNSSYYYTVICVAKA